MQLHFTPEQEAFRLEVRAFVKAHLPADIRRKVELGLRLEHADYVTWFRILQARGWLTPGWPVAHGGPGWDHVPISRAVQASAALPGLFPPVEIDGQHFVDGALIKTMHASIALDEGVDLMLCINMLHIDFPWIVLAAGAIGWLAGRSDSSPFVSGAHGKAGAASVDDDANEGLMCVVLSCS